MENLNINNILFNPLFWVMSLSTIIIIFFVVFYYRFVRKRIKINIVKSYGSAYKVVKRKNLKLGTKTFTNSEEAYAVDLNRSILDTRNNPILYYRQDHAEKLKIMPINEIDKVKSSKALKNILESDFVQKMFNPAKDKFLLLLCVGLGVGIVCIAVFSIWRIGTLQTQIAEILAQGGTVIS